MIGRIARDVLLGAVAFGVLGVGFLWRASERPEAPDQAPPVRLSLAPETVAAGLEPPRSGKIAVFLGLTAPGDDDVLQIADWLESNDVPALVLGFEDADGKEIGRARLGGGRRSVRREGGADGTLFIDRADLTPSDRPAAAVRIESEGTSLLALIERGGFVQIGRSEELAAGSWSQMIASKSGRRPGLVILAGLALVFTHFFFLAARLVVPVVKAAEPGELLLPTAESLHAEFSRGGLR